MPVVASLSSPSGPGDCNAAQLPSLVSCSEPPASEPRQLFRTASYRASSVVQNRQLPSLVCCVEPPATEPRQLCRTASYRASSVVQNRQLPSLVSCAEPPATEHRQLILLLLKKVGSARLRESDIDPVSPKTPASQYQPRDRNKRKGKRVENYSRDSAA